jgi:molybdate transport system permease protein
MELSPYKPSTLLQRIEPVLHLAIADSRGADHQRAIRDRIRNRLVLLRMFQQARGTHRRSRLPKRNLVGVHHSQVQKAEIAHRASRRAEVERVSRGDKHNPQAVGFRNSRHPAYSTMLGRAVEYGSPHGKRLQTQRNPSEMDWEALFLTLRLDLVVCGFLLILGVPIAFWLTFSRWRWKFLVEAVVALPLVLPPTVLGFYLLIVMGPRSPVGRVYGWIWGHGLPFTFSGLVLASIVYSLPFMVQPVAAAFAAVDPKVIAASEVLGASRIRTLFRVVAPLSFGGLLTGVVLTFAHTLGEFGVVLMVGGNIPGVTRTVSVSIYDNVQSLDYRSAAQMSLLLLITSFLILAVVYATNRRASIVWPARRS